ncbi:hypothetical protein J4462_05080 [Candidatus Pacearchaeota archaeon]|nr:hypothetical protein [Candidatus Pacearchaeota archaeon]
MDWKSFSYGVLTVFVLLLAMASFGFAHIGKINAINGNVIGIGNSLNGIPEECRVPAGQDVNSWKEHLGHHTETKECLKYFN